MLRQVARSLAQMGSPRYAIVAILGFVALSCGAKTGLEIPCTIAVEPSTPQIVVAVDHSGEGDYPVATHYFDRGSCALWEFEWTVATLNVTLPLLDSTTSLGLYVFPEVGVEALFRDGICTTPPDLLLPIARNHGGAALAVIHQWTNGLLNSCPPTDLQPAGAPPVDAALRIAASALALTPRHAPHFIILFTADVPRCGDFPPAECLCPVLTPPAAPCGPGAQVECMDSDRAVATVRDLREHQGINTLVIGNDPHPAYVAGWSILWAVEAFYEAAAQAGGLPRTGSSRSWYGTGEVAAIQQALETTIVPSGLCLPRATQVPGNLADYVLESAQRGLLTRDPTHTDGWDWTDVATGEIGIYGPTCRQVMQDSAALKLVQPRRLCVE